MHVHWIIEMRGAMLGRGAGGEGPTSGIGLGEGRSGQLLAYRQTSRSWIRY